MSSFLRLARKGPIADEHRRLSQALGAPLPPGDHFERDRYPAEAIGEATCFWRQRTRSEHRSVAVFTLLAAQLIEANMRIESSSVMLRLAQDELRHAELCARVVEVLGDATEIAVDCSITRLASHEGCPDLEKILRNVIYTTCLSETIATARLVDALEHTSDPFIRQVTRLIIRDEVLHGQYGFHLLDELSEREELSTDLCQQLGHYLRHAFAVLEEELCSAELSRVKRPSLHAQKLGVIDPRRARDVFMRCVQEVIVPGLTLRGIDAHRAWTERRRLD